MKQSIQLRLSQQLTMTPQLQQAIRLLQLSTLELQLEVQQALESNVMLENEEELEQQEPALSIEIELSNRNGSNGSSAESEVNQTPADIPEDLPVDSAWEDVYDTGGMSYSNYDGDDREYDHAAEIDEKLHDYLLWQLQLTPFNETDFTIASVIVDSINDDGYLTCSLEDVLEAVKEDLGEVELDEVEAVLHRIQNFDPPGIGCRDLGECLYLQLRQLPDNTPFRREAMRLVTEHLDLLAGRDQQLLMRRARLDEETLREALALVRSLNPHPGNSMPSTTTEYIVPDVYVRKMNGAWRVELNPETTPRLRINTQYAGMIRRADNSADNTTLKSHLQEARWFIKSLQSRNETLLKVASCIVERQQAFLDYGEEAMKPMVLRDVAETIEMHESTISRVTTRKYMHTPRGIFEFKYFFSSHVSTASGGECSATAIRALMKKLVAAENPAKPLSDSKIARILSDQGIQVARRTVAKYREAMCIPPSNERKRLI
ncbi:MAG: RNA polymerase factor sigma-54 [Proteobacteria bacterium]|nr:MAG: RNA polymerase factor sigma-54 [Pseudomonadota bacterium]QKK11879.1 MAG: RNA polymerase factor sigma-54 [Pseudomonadota bacterium]